MLAERVNSNPITHMPCSVRVPLAASVTGADRGEEARCPSAPEGPTGRARRASWLVSRIQERGEAPPPQALLQPWCTSMISRVRSPGLARRSSAPGAYTLQRISGMQDAPGLRRTETQTDPPRDQRGNAGRRPLVLAPSARPAQLGDQPGPASPASSGTAALGTPNGMIFGVVRSYRE